jgi:hypothetical protein
MMFDGFSASGFAASIGASMVNPLMPCCISGMPIAITKNANVKTPKSTLKVKFTEEEDKKLTKLVQQFGVKDWIKISQLMETRNPRQCRERWNNYVNPALRTEPWTADEDKILEEKFAEFGPRWNKISKFFVNRSDNNIRNRWMMIARHRAKNQKSPISPAPTQRVEPPQYVMPVVKEIRVAETRPPSNPFEFIGEQKQPLYSHFDEMEFELWNDFSFY